MASASASASAAAVCNVPPRKVVAVDHPLVVKNLENGLKTFGRNQPFERVRLNPISFPYLYLMHLPYLPFTLYHVQAS